MSNQSINLSLRQDHLWVDLSFPPKDQINQSHSQPRSSLGWAEFSPKGSINVNVNVKSNQINQYQSHTRLPLSRTKYPSESQCQSQINQSHLRTRLPLS